MQDEAILPGYERLPGDIPVVCAPEHRSLAEKTGHVLETGATRLSRMLGVDPPELQALLVSEKDWEAAPREGERVYPPGLPYFTRSLLPPALVLPAFISPVFRPRTVATYPLIFWHELAHAFLLQNDVVRTPAWLGELVPQAASAAIARGSGLPFEEHLNRIDREPGFTVRSLKGHADADRQMSFQNLLLVLGAGAVEEFGDGFLKRLVHALWEESDAIDEARAEELLADALGPGGRMWLRSRPEF